MNTTLIKENKTSQKYLVCLLICFVFPCFSQSSDAEKLHNLEKQLALLTKEVAAMKRALEEKTIEQKSTKETIVKVEQVRVETPIEENQLLKFGGRFQLDYNRFNGAYNASRYGKTASDLFPRRIRTYVASKHGDWDYKLLLDFVENGGQVTLARVRYKGFENGPTVKFGKIREDISLEALTSSKHSTAISRPMLSNVMSPYFKYGISANHYFEKNRFRYALGVFKSGSFGAYGKDENGKMNYSVTGRLTWAPIVNKDEILHFGLWGSHRDMGGDSLLPRFSRGEVRNTDVRLVNYASGGNLFKIDDMVMYGVELAGVYGPLSIQAEYAKRDVKATNSHNNNSYDGYYVTASYFLTGENRVYKKRGVFISPKPFSNMGAWEIFARFSQFDATSVNQGTAAEVVTVGVTHYLNKEIKFMANYLMSDVTGPGANDLVGVFKDGEAFTARFQYLF